MTEPTRRGVEGDMFTGPAWDESAGQMNLVETNSPFAAAATYMRSIGLTPTEDAIEQLAGPFASCLRIMCERGYEPGGALWKHAGLFGVMTDVKKKFDRYWYRTWTLGRRHDDSGLDLINFTGMSLRSDPDSRWGDLGEPSAPGGEASDEHYR